MPILGSIWSTEVPTEVYRPSVFRSVTLAATMSLSLKVWNVPNAAVGIVASSSRWNPQAGYPPRNLWRLCASQTRTRG